MRADPAAVASTLARLASRLVEDGSISDDEQGDLMRGAELLKWLAANADPLRDLARHLAARHVVPEDKNASELELLKRHPHVVELFKAFPDAQIIGVRKIASAA